uniref:NADH-ubiquinone oxidoreductase chain 5 n=1 Tax=Trichogramma ostriniae TaxID=99200 RepID=A0A384SKP0_9HYME|nr:NADH dehydrogenase subunit 5 [Trichogramma ostriniae]AOM68246.1 NADH dehydrogenase subunit 5 [Trichogramma ostriniae]
MNFILYYYLSGVLFFLVSMNMFFLFIYFFLFNMVNFIEFNFFFLNSVNINMFVYMDWMTFLFIFTVLLISSMIMIYSSEYMSHDLNNVRFFYLVFLFILSMILMILSPNMISILLGWDGLGLISYCLVIYYQSNSSYNSGMLTVLMNRVGDIMIIMSISLMFIYGSWNFVNYSNMFIIIILLIMIGSFTKSAQFPFSVWLPAAMAAPTPVSSLVHSSTLVTAGVYLLIRFNYIFYLNDYFLSFIMMIGLITMMMAGFSANFDFDLKKIIAFSTLSQLGLMMMIYSLKNYNLTFFHLIIHAMFKSMMFMCSGIIIHNMMNYQDIRFMGKLKNFMPMTSMIFMISNLSLCGLPFFSGFYSKDQILEFMFLENISFYIYLLLILSTMLTVSYSIRLSYYLMCMKFNFINLFNIVDNKKMNFSMLLLMFFSIKFGLFLNLLMFNNIEYIYLLNFEKLILLIICYISIFIGLFMFKMKIDFKFNYMMKFFFGSMYFYSNLNFFYTNIFLIFGNLIFKVFDKGWSEMFFKKSFYYYIYKFNNLNILNKNFLMYLLMIFSYLIIIMMIMF